MPPPPQIDLVEHILWNMEARGTIELKGGIQHETCGNVLTSVTSTETADVPCPRLLMPLFSDHFEGGDFSMPNPGDDNVPPLIYSGSKFYLNV